MKTLVIVSVLMLAACAKALPQPHIDPCKDPCAAIGYIGPTLDLTQPSEERKEEWPRLCEDLRRKKRWSPCK
jgi:hypothetical protein